MTYYLYTISTVLYQGFLNGENVMFPYVHKQHNADKALSCEMTKYIMHNLRGSDTHIRRQL